MRKLINIGLLVLSVVLIGCSTYNSDIENDKLSVEWGIYYSVPMAKDTDNIYVSDTGDTTWIDPYYPRRIKFWDGYYIAYYYKNDPKPMIKATYTQKGSNVTINTDPNIQNGEFIFHTLTSYGDSIYDNYYERMYHSISLKYKDE